MIINRLIDEDFANYRVPSMFISFPYCDFKCCIEQNLPTSICQNHLLLNEKIILVEAEKLVERYLSNPITSAVVMGGMEPFKSFPDVEEFISYLRNEFKDKSTVVIYTGYYPNEIVNDLTKLKKYGNIILKYGRFIINSEPRYDEILGVTLNSKNQYAEWLC